MQTSWTAIEPSERCYTWVKEIPSKIQGQLRIDWKSFWGGGFGGVGWQQAQTWSGNVHSQPKKATVSWAAAKAVWTAGLGRGFCLSALLWSAASRCGASNTKKMYLEHLESVQRRAIEVIKGLECLSFEEVVQHGEGRFWGDPVVAFQYPNGAHKKAEVGLFTMACSDRSRGNALNSKDFY